MKSTRFITMLLLGLFFYSCDDNDGVDLIDSSDPNAVIAALEVEGAVFIEGMPPLPSEDQNAPKLWEYEYDELAKVGAGGNMNYSVDLSQGDVAGLYFQIEGADGYLDIPKTTLNQSFEVSDKHYMSRLLQTQEDFALVIPIPEALTSGEICVNYCVYDSENRVSNVVSRCIEIVEPGGKNGDFLVGEWNAIKYVDHYDGMTYEYYFGVPDEYTYGTTIPCNDEIIEVEITESYEDKFLHVTYSKNGGLRYKAEMIDIYLDEENSNCSPSYLEETTAFDLNGVWSYDDSNGSIVLALEYEFSFEGVEKTENVAIEGSIALEDGLLVLTQVGDEYPDEIFKMYFEKK
ncbi:hypothetical protein [Reichenbachiella ulvae]|uniref:Uncharacterized protein n=1 Tax=Reichenbachiella ulvae TaxID=2980104 RepID=A0ABT3CPD7_9BACT|nr:hypothetical protein [Reichenbachiella ulvae]MCV9385570.1 hypothetical protein [Reichenbachiella ulvae]